MDEQMNGHYAPATSKHPTCDITGWSHRRYLGELLTKCNCCDVKFMPVMSEMQWNDRDNTAVITDWLQLTSHLPRSQKMFCWESQWFRRHQTHIHLSYQHVTQTSHSHATNTSQTPSSSAHSISSLVFQHSILHFTYDLSSSSFLACNSKIA